MSSLLASVVVPTHNRAAIIAQTVPRLLEQTVPRERYEVLLVDDGSTDDTAAVAERLARDGVTYLPPSPRRGRAATRNRGIEAARGGILVFLDDDGFVGRDFLERHLRRHAGGRRVMAAGGIVDVGSPPARDHAVPWWRGYHRSRFPTGNASVRREEVVRAGGFDEEFSLYGWEDTELAERLRRAGLRREFVWGAPVFHYRWRDEPWPLDRLVALERERGRMGALFARKHPRVGVAFVTKTWWPFRALDRAAARLLALDETLAEIARGELTRVSAGRWALLRVHAEIAAAREAGGEGSPLNVMPAEAGIQSPCRVPAQAGGKLDSRFRGNNTLRAMGMRGSRSDARLLALWILLGAALRFVGLTLKSVWVDEFSTLVFSLGHDFTSVPVDRVIDYETLMRLVSAKAGGAYDVWMYVTHQTNHPPLYFLLANIWMRAVPAGADGYVSIFAARALPALLGVASIPAMYLLGRVALGSCTAAHVAAALMATSPFAVYLSQDARHYTLALLWTVLSLTCFAAAYHTAARGTRVPAWLAASWIAVHWLGVATHYFFVLVLAAEGMAVVVTELRGRGSHAERAAPRASTLAAVAIGSALGCLVWLPVWRQQSSPVLTEWIRSAFHTPMQWLGPVLQTVAVWITMLSLLPVEASSVAVVAISGAVMLALFLWLLPRLWMALRDAVRLTDRERGLTIALLATVVGCAVAIFLAISYLTDIEITRGRRYHFVYLPAVLALVAAGLAALWERGRRLPATLALAMGIASALTVALDLGYRRLTHPETFVPYVERTSPNEVILSTTYRGPTDTRLMLSLAWEYHRQSIARKPRILMAGAVSPTCAVETCRPLQILAASLAAQGHSVDLWLVDFHADSGATVRALTSAGCALQVLTAGIYEYPYHHFLCGGGRR